MTGMQIANKAKDQLTTLTGLKAETVSAFTKNSDGYQVSVEMLEMVHVPNCLDVLATYEVQLDPQGNIISYLRTRRYHRSETFEKEENRA